MEPPPPETSVLVVRPPLARRLRWPAFAALVGAAWLVLVAVHGQHAAGDGPDTGGIVLMWTLMGVAMMAPTSLPTLRAYVELADEHDGGAAFWAFLAGFAAVWTAAAAVGAALELLLASADALDAGGAAAPLLVVLLLAGAAAYQLAPAKARFAGRCREPRAVLAARFRPGRRGALALGARHGADCVGSCWALMLLGLVGGLAGLVWMSLAMVVIGVEKTPGLGDRVERPLAAALGLASLAAAAVALA